MARVRKSELAFDAISLEGSLISPAKLAEVAERKAGQQTEADYNIPKGLSLRDETARYFRIGQALFRELFSSGHPSHQATIRFTQELLRDVFGFVDIEPTPIPRHSGDRTFVVSLEALKGRVPVVVVPPADDLDHASTHLSHDRRRSAATSLQDWLNADENSLWGLGCNGEHLRLLRDNESLTRPAYLEANLRQIFESEDFAGFAVLWLIAHASRFGRPGSPATDCALERWREAGSKEGLAARERLSVGVKEALLALGNGFLSHPANTELRDRLTGGQLALPDFFNELLRLVYRLIFLLAAEDRGLLHPPETSETARRLYAEGYSLGSLRDRAIRRSGWDQFHDRWEGLLIVFRSLAHGEPRLGLPALGGLFEAHATPALDHARLSNRALMETIFRLAWLREESSIVPVNWRDMETEELGSVYEGLLELTPRLTQDGRGLAFAEGLETKGNERKKTGSYYTPDSLVQALLDSTLDPVLDRVENEAEDAPAALLGLSVIDPACGSGHFLLAAARRIATRIARLRTGGVPSAADYRHALRDVVRCCIHGVDRNPMAIELARVALWIETVEPGKPLGFLDASLRVGDSLLGIFDLEALRQGIPDAAYKPLTGDDKATANDFLKRNRSDKGARQDIFDFAGGNTRARAATLPDLAASLRAVRQLPEDTGDEVEAKRTKYRAALSEAHLTNLEQAADLYIAAFLTPKTKATLLDLHTSPVPTTDDVWKAMRGSTVYGPRLGAARELAAKSHAFHWPLQFPDVMAAGGFHLVVGNPPWDVVQLNEEEHFAQHWPEVAELVGASRKKAIAALKETNPSVYEDYLAEKRRFEASNEFARSSGRFVLSARGKVNTYSLFAELVTSLLGSRGQAGIVLPTGIATDVSSAALFADIMGRDQLISLMDFENREGLFPSVDSRFKFCLLTVGKSVSPPRFVFFLQNVTQISAADRSFRVTPADIALINPITRTIPIIRTRFEAELLTEIHRRIPTLNQPETRPKSRWNISAATRLWNMSEDASWFRLAEDLVSEGFQKEGNSWVIRGANSPGEVSKTDRYVPLYEAKLIHQFDHRWATYSSSDSRDCTPAEKGNADFEPVTRYYVPNEEVEARLRGVEWYRHWVLSWRKIARATDERTCIVSAIPRCAMGHSAGLIFVHNDEQSAMALMANLNSLVLDFIARLKVGGTNLTYGHIEQFPVLPPSAYKSSDLEFVVQRALELSYTSYSIRPLARDLGYDRPPFEWDEQRRALLRAELDAWYARAFGLTRDELRYILDPVDMMGPDYPSETFRVLKINEIRLYGEFRTQRLVMEAWDRMESGDLLAPQPYSAPRLSSGLGENGVNPLLGAGPLFEEIEETR